METSVKLEKIREKMYEAIDKYGINSKETLKISARLDKLLNHQYDYEPQYQEGSEMKNNYDISYNKLKELTNELGDFPTIKEWNKCAKENNLLSHISIEYISGYNWKTLRDFVMTEVTDKK